MIFGGQFGGWRSEGMFFQNTEVWVSRIVKVCFFTFSICVLIISQGMFSLVSEEMKQHLCSSTGLWTSKQWEFWGWIFEIEYAITELCPVWI